VPFARQVRDSCSAPSPPWPSAETPMRVAKGCRSVWPASWTCPGPGCSGVPRTRRRTLMVRELLYVGWAAVTCSLLPCAIDSRRAKAHDRLVPDGAGTERRRYFRTPATASTPVPMPCTADSKPSAARCASWSTPPTRRSPRPSSAPTAPASSWRAAFLYDGGIVAGPEGIITGGHASKTGRTVAILYGEAVTTHARRPAPAGRALRCCEDRLGHRHLSDKSGVIRSDADPGLARSRVGKRKAAIPEAGLASRDVPVPRGRSGRDGKIGTCPDANTR
jgi:hypothetical protein